MRGNHQDTVTLCQVRFSLADLGSIITFGIGVVHRTTRPNHGCKILNQQWMVFAFPTSRGSGLWQQDTDLCASFAVDRGCSRGSAAWGGTAAGTASCHD